MTEEELTEEEKAEEEKTEIIAWAKATIQEPEACCNAYELALEYLIELDPDNRDKWIEKQTELREARDWQSDG